MSREEWRPVPSHPDILVSNMGRVLLPPRRALMPNGGYRTYDPKPIIGVIARSKKGATHCYRNMWTKERGNLKIHQLVCEAFHGPKPFPEAIVLHRDEDGLNNRESNLKWGTQVENLNMPKIKAYHRSRIGNLHPKALARSAAA